PRWMGGQLEGQVRWAEEQAHSAPCDFGVHCRRVELPVHCHSRAVDRAGVLSRFRPAMWNMGVTVSTSSAAVIARTSTVAGALATSASCVSTAPLGVPVVPDVKAMSTGDDAPACAPGESGGPSHGCPMEKARMGICQEPAHSPAACAKLSSATRRLGL